MRPIVYTTDELVRAFDEHRILTLEQVKGFLGTTVKMTALRKLRALDYVSSYSHTGRYYTLRPVARWDGHGLWVHKGIRFSRHGSLLETLSWLIDQSADGRFASELEEVVRVRVQEAVRTLYRRERVFRHQIVGQYLYVSVESGTTQLERRQAEAEQASLGVEPSEPHLAVFLDTLNEKQRRVYAGFESLRLGHGGDVVVARRTGLNVKTVARGRKELQAGDLSLERIRAEGAGRPRTKKTLERLEVLLANDTAGDPMTGLKWTRRSTYTLSAALAAEDLAACPNTVASLLKEKGFSLKRNRKEIGETQHPQRNAQFEHIAVTKDEFQDRGQPMISVDSKKRELVGNFLNPGQTWCREAQRVLTHDFRTQAQGVALPYGIYDWVGNRGTVIVGTSHDTSEFAVDAIETWLTSYGWYQYPHMTELLILCDAGGSNSCRTHLWKYALSQRLVQEHGISVRLCHYPSGASKWNPIDHRLFSQISLNWAGVPLTSHQVVLNYIRTVSTKTGLTVDATLNRKRYDTGKKVPKDEFKQINLTPHMPLPQWNYTIAPHA